jgi:hypothetical protein
VDLGVENCEGEAVVGEAVKVAALDAGDEAVAAKPGEVVASLIHAVAAAEQSGHQGAQALVGDAGDGEQGGGQGAGQGLDPRIAEPSGRGPPPIHRGGWVRDPLEGWARKDTALADPLSIEQTAVDRTGAGVKFGQVV